MITEVRAALRSARVLFAFRISMAVLSTLPSLLVAKAFLTSFSMPGDAWEPFTDGITYLAAGERLNAGHALYASTDGDRPVVLPLPNVATPLVSPPPIAVIWRPLAAVPFGIGLWVLATSAALLGTMVYLVVAVGWRAALGCVLLCYPIGEQLAVANVAAFFPLMLVLAWRFRDQPYSGAMIGFATALKLSPAPLFGWLVGHRRRAAFWGAAAFAATLAVGAIGAGPSTYVDYMHIAAQPISSPYSLSVLTGIPWLSFAVLASGMVASALVRREALAFGVAVAASVAGNPALYAAGLVPLLALMAPLVRDTAAEAGRAVWADGDGPRRKRYRWLLAR